MIAVQLEETDLANAYALHKRWGIKMWSLYCIITVVYVGLGLWLLLFFKALAIFGVISIIFAIINWVMAGIGKLVLIPRIAKRRFKQQKGLQQPYTVSWNSDTLSIESPTGTSNTPWSDFLKWRANERLFLIYVTNGLFRIVPKRVFENPASVKEFDQLLQTKIGPPS